MGPLAKQKKLVFGMNPLWGHASFIDLFADAFIPKNFGTEKEVWRRLTSRCVRGRLRWSGW